MTKDHGYFLFKCTDIVDNIMVAVYLGQPDLYCLCFLKTKLCQCEISVTRHLNVL